jgi:tetratricopeptide (TPR) repeat protein
VEKPDLWNQFGDRTERGLLFTAEDFKNPDQSDVFRELENLSPAVKELALKLKEFCKLLIDQLEPLEVVLPKTSPAQVIYHQGLAYLHRNRYNEAIGEFKKAITLDPKFREAYHGLGLAHLKMGDSGEAKRAAEAALRIDSHYQPAHQLLDAIKFFKPPPPPPPPPGGSGQASTKGWQYITGALAFILLICIVALAIQIDAKDEVLHRIAMLTNQQVETDSELDAANSSIRTLSNGKTRLLRENQKLRNELTEQDEETKTQIVIAKQLRSEKEELHNRNQELRNENSMLRNQSKLDATNSSIRTLSNEKARLLRENQKLQNQLTEKNRETRTQMAIVQQLRSEKEEFLSQKQKLQHENVRLQEQLDKQRPPLDPSPIGAEQFRAAPLQKIYRNISPEVKSNALSKNNQGYFDFNKGKYDDAIKYFENAIKSDPQAAVIHYNLGSTYLKMKEYTKAVNYLQKAVKFDPEFKEAHYNLALALGKGTVKWR